MARAGTLKKSDHFRTVADAAELLGPSPAWLTLGRLAAWSAGSSLLGWILRGHVADDDAERGKRVWMSLASRTAAPYDFVLDLRALETTSRGAYARIQEFAMTRKPGLRRMAVLVGDRASGGAIQVGLYAMRPPAFEWRSFRSYRAVAAWLDRPDAAAALRAVDVWTRHELHPPAPLARFRGLLDAAPHASMTELAGRLGWSRRTLQRSLLAWGTTFSRERDRARVACAQELLIDPTAKLDAVAAHIGCADRRTLNRLLRRVTGESAGEFRERQSAALAAPRGASRRRRPSAATR